MCVSTLMSDPQIRPPLRLRATGLMLSQEVSFVRRIPLN